MQNLFFKAKTSNDAVYKTDERFNFYQGVNPEQLTKTFNNIFLLFWECTPFKEEHKVPTMLMSINDDETATATFQQIYSSEQYSDSVKKEIILQKDGNNWKITAEKLIDGKY